MIVVALVIVDSVSVIIFVSLGSVADVCGVSIAMWPFVGLLLWSWLWHGFWLVLVGG